MSATGAAGPDHDLRPRRRHNDPSARTTPIMANWNGRACFSSPRSGLYAVAVALAAMSAYSESVMRLPEPDSDGEDHDHSHFHAGSLESSDSEEENS